MQPLGLPSQKTPLVEQVNGFPLATQYFYSWFSRIETQTQEARRDIDSLNGHGTRAERLALTVGDLPACAIFVETDTTLVYQVHPGDVWQWIAGVYERTQAQLAALAADLGSNDTGLRVFVSNLNHVLMWTGSIWTWAPEDARQAGQIAWFDVDPGTGWHLVNGTGDDGSPIDGSHPIKILKSDGTLRNNTTAADMTGGVHIRGAAAYDGSVTAATVPTLSGSTASGAASLGANSSTVGVTAGVVVVAANGHIHTDAGHTHAAGTLAAALPEDPVQFSEALPYIRK